MEIKVRVGTTDDVDALVEVECSDIEKWYHYSSKGRGDEAQYDSLSSMERYMHGGPWTDRESLIQYWEYIERLDVIPLVAEINGRIVGYIDVLFSDELPLGSFLYLDVLMVHRDFRRRGVATALIKESERLASKRKMMSVLVEPQESEGPSGQLYRSCGFEKNFERYDMETTTRGSMIPHIVQLAAIPRTLGPPLKTHSMVCGWYNISAKRWDSCVNPHLKMMQFLFSNTLALSVLTREDIHYIHVEQGMFDHSKGTLALWSPLPLDESELREVLQAAKTVSMWLGIEKLETKTLERYIGILKELGFYVKSKAEPYLMKAIN